MKNTIELLQFFGTWYSFVLIVWSGIWLADVVHEEPWSHLCHLGLTFIIIAILKTVMEPTKIMWDFAYVMYLVHVGAFGFYMLVWNVLHSFKRAAQPPSWLISLQLVNLLAVCVITIIRLCNQ